MTVLENIQEKNGVIFLIQLIKRTNCFHIPNLHIIEYPTGLLRSGRINLNSGHSAALLLQDGPEFAGMASHIENIDAPRDQSINLRKDRLWFSDLGLRFTVVFQIIRHRSTFTYDGMPPHSRDIVD